MTASLARRSSSQTPALVQDLPDDTEAASVNLGSSDESAAVVLRWRLHRHRGSACSQSVLLLLCSLAVRCVVWFVVGDTDLISQPYGLIFCLINSPQHNEVKAHLDGKGQTQTASLPHTRSVFGSLSLNDSKPQVEEPTAPPGGRSAHCRRHTYSHSLENLSPDPCAGLSTT